MKTVIQILLVVAIGFLSYFCVMSIVTPIRFTETKEAREKVIIKRLVDIRTAQTEYKDQKGGYTANFDELIEFLKTSKKKTVLKEGSLTDKQLEAGLTEAKAVAIVKKGNAKEIADNGLEHFRRDTTYLDLLDAVYEGRYTKETISQLAYIPYSENQKFEMKVNNTYFNSNGIQMSLFEASAGYKTYLYDLDKQEVLNLIDVQHKLDRYAGLRVGSVESPNNNAGNWE